MADVSNRNRQPEGQSIGGQFDNERHAESGVELGDPWGDFLAHRDGVEPQAQDGSEQWREIEARDAADYEAWMRESKEKHSHLHVERLRADYQHWVGKGYPRTSAREMAERGLHGLHGLPDLSQPPPWHGNEDPGGDQDVAEARAAYREAQDMETVASVYETFSEGDATPDFQSLKGLPGFEEIRFERVREFTDKWDAIAEEYGNLDNALEDAKSSLGASQFRGEEEDKDLSAEIETLEELIDDREADARAMDLGKLIDTIQNRLEEHGPGLEHAHEAEGVTKEKAEGLRRALFYKGLGAEARFGQDPLDGRQWVQQTRISQESLDRLPAVPEQYRPDLDA